MCLIKITRKIICSDGHIDDEDTKKINKKKCAKSFLPTEQKKIFKKIARKIIIIYLFHFVGFGIK